MTFDDDPDVAFTIDADAMIEARERAIDALFNEMAYGVTDPDYEPPPAHGDDCTCTDCWPTITERRYDRGHQ